MRPTLIATDLDGTLLRHDGTVSARTLAAIDAAESAGIELVIVTGRPPRWIPPVIELVGDRGLVICANGAIVYDPGRREIVERNDMSGPEALDVVQRLRAAVPALTFGVEQGFGFGIEPGYLPVEDWDMADDIIEASIDELCGEPVSKVLVRHPAPAPDGLGDMVRAILGGRAGVTHSSDETFLELSRPGVHKASTLERLVAKSGVEAAGVVAFGDMPNDIEMLTWAGHGVAMANAHPAVQRVADEVTASNDDDGVALVIERVLGE